MFERLVARWRERKFRWAVFPTRRMATLVAGAALLWLVPGIAGRIIAAVALIAIFVAAATDYVLLPSPSDLVVERDVPDRMGLGDRYEIVYTVRSRAARPALARLYAAIPDGIAARAVDDAVVLAPDRPMELRVATVGERRGRFDFSGVALRLETRRKLVARIARFDLHNETTVVPSLSNVRRLRLLAIQNRLSDAGVRALKQRGEGTSFAGLRDYVPGDDPRLLDWKATARHARLITREQSIERSQTVVTMVDCGRAMTQLAGRYARFEHVLSAALVLSDVAAASGDRVGLLAFDDDVRAFVPPQKGLAALRSLRTALSGLDATLTEPDYAAAFRVLAIRQRRRALIVFFTDVIDTRAAQLFLTHATRAARRHLLVVVAIQNEELAAAARPSVSGAAALYRSAAAEELIREREEALARMRLAGIAVLDISAGRMGAAVVNRYLEIKARGLL
jgi:uncharacterized protein (DUF58 family)